MLDLDPALGVDVHGRQDAADRAPPGSAPPQTVRPGQRDRGIQAPRGPPRRAAHRDSASAVSSAPGLHRERLQRHGAAAGWCACSCALSPSVRVSHGEAGRERRRKDRPTVHATLYSTPSLSSTAKYRWSKLPRATMLILDAHLDLSMNALEWNRDLTRPIEEIRARERDQRDKPDRGQGTVSLPEMRRGGVGLCVATLIARYVAPDNPLPGWHSQEQAWATTQGQLAWYRAMEERGELVQIRDRRHWTRISAPGSRRNLVLRSASPQSRRRRLDCHAGPPGAQPTRRVFEPRPGALRARRLRAGTNAAGPMSRARPRAAPRDGAARDHPGRRRTSVTTASATRSTVTPADRLGQPLELPVPRAA